MLNPNQTALRESPNGFTFSDFGGRLRKAWQQIRGSTQVIDGDEAHKQLHKNGLVVHNRAREVFKFLQDGKDHKPSLKLLSNDLNIHNDINRLLWVFTSKKRPLPEKMKIVPAIQSVYDFLFVHNGFDEADPLRFADNDPREKTLSIWELFLQIRGRCMKVEGMYKQKELVEKLKKEKEELLRQLERAQIEEGTLAEEALLQSQLVVQLKNEAGDSGNEELQKRLLYAQQEEDRLGKKLREQTEMIRQFQSKYKETFQQLQEAASSELGQKELEIQKIREEYRGKLRALKEENEELNTKVIQLYGKIDSMEHKISHSQHKEKKVQKEVIEVTVGKDQKREIAKLQKEKQQLEEDVAYYQAQSNQLLTVHEKALTQRNRSDSNAEQAQEELKLLQTRDAQIRALIQKTNEKYPASGDIAKQAIVLYGLLDQLNHLYKSK